MLAPKRVKFRKRFKGRTSGMATRGNTVAFGHYGLERHESVVAERDGVAARGHPRSTALEPLAKLDALRCEHGLDARRIGAAVEILGPLALENPDLHPNRAKRRLGGGGRVVDVRPQRMQ